MKKFFSRRRAMGVVIGLIAGWWIGGMAASAQKAGGSLQGVWKVTVTPDDDSKKGGAKEMTLTLDFGPATFKVEEWEKKGFKPAEYQTDERRFGPTKFDGTLVNEKEKTKAKWSGLATAQDISGDLVWTTKNGDELKYSFKGDKK